MQKKSFEVCGKFKANDFKIKINTGGEKKQLFKKVLHLILSTFEINIIDLL